jgi:hypothetical protein
VSLEAGSQHNRILLYVVFSRPQTFHFAGKKSSSQIKIFSYLFHTNSDEEKLYITIVHLEKIYNF